MSLGICKLCCEKKELQRSHVIGKTVFSRILRKSVGNAGISICLKDKKISKSNDTWDSKLLCKSCESFFNRKFEDYSIHVLRKEQKGVNASESELGIFLKNVDQYRLILYICSIYWRAAYSSHESYNGIVIERGISQYLVNVFTDKCILNPTLISARIRLLADENVGKLSEHPVSMIVNPYHRLTQKGYMFCMAFEGYFFELFINSSSFKDRLKPGYLNRKEKNLFIPLVYIEDIPEIAESINQTRRIYEDSPDKGKYQL
ncbi:hypothetical protein ABTQ09_15575 [Acinetobacter baumannii]|uniref:hypothetical protein n=1 Tax=Acinetobacter baumannii TaxID=470 RepID=UPI00035583A0|nr:hypothetical protein [Acinetobacter baumannii]AGQ06684.1 hypothetical protein BJAB0715_02038 [Acinetobacter baumannii BJAB0715]AMN01609.1 hypothetical protein AZE33_10505 [Acinetobacter baumannii]MDB0262114.1 hypothetical protein [Acinetobacter baumannii]MDB0305755.1 hypothetical protein [Acinetobacter baumannii]MVO49854.1 hypothetical protein [Acinetobacter baumannii]